jgi:hypothetical protein
MFVNSGTRGYARYLPSPPFIKPGTRQTGLTGRFQKSFGINCWHLLRKGEKTVAKERTGKGFSG